MIRVSFAALLVALAIAWPATAGESLAAAPQRVITLSPHATELVYAVGGGDQIVGTITSSDFPEAAKSVPRVGDGILLNQERIIMLKPTLLIGWQASGAALEVAPLARRLGAEVVYSMPQRLRDIPADVRHIGHLLGREAPANELASAMESRIDALETRYADQEAVTVFIEAGSMPLYTIGGDPLLNDALRICGAVNIYGDSGIPAPRVPVESVLIRDPDLIVAPQRHGTDARQLRERWTGYGLGAAINGRVHIADPDALFRPGPRLIDATEDLCAAIDAIRGDRDGLSLDIRPIAVSTHLS